MGHIRPQETVDKALRMSDQGVLDRDIAAACGVAIKTVRRWRRLYRRQGLRRGQRHTSVACPRCHDGDIDKAAYAQLLGWYLGDGHIVAYKRGVYLLAIFNDRKYERLNEEIRELFEAVKPGGRPFTRSLPGAVSTGCYWKHWPCLFPQHGPGMKHMRKIELQRWQQEIVAEFPGLFLRGLFNSDGCRIENWTTKFVNGERKRYEYPRYFFTQKSTDIMGLCQWALDLLGVRWTMPRINSLSVARKADVALLDEFIGPKS
jgi:hypothetical protein